jgi:lysophospholipase
MRPTTLAAALASLAVSAAAAATPTGDAVLDRRALVDAIAAKTLVKLAARQASNATQSTYAPLKNQSCPFPAGTSYIRPATSLSPNETAYTAARLESAKDPLRAFFARANVSVDGLDQLLSDSSTTPRVAIAISGGGYRAMLHGSGGLAALDARNETGVSGLLQGSVYMAGLSGGSWAVTVSKRSVLPARAWCLTVHVEFRGCRHGLAVLP